MECPNSLTVCRQHVCWILSSGDLEVWDWRVGTRIWVCDSRTRARCASCLHPIYYDDQCCETSRFAGVDFAFIDPFHLAVILINDTSDLFSSTLDIYCLAPPCSDRRVSFLGYEGLVCSLRMPSPIHPDLFRTIVNRLSCNAHPAPLPFRPRCDPDKCALGSSLLVINFTVSQQGMESPFALLIPPWTLDREIRKSLTRYPVSEFKTAIHWDDWGPRGSIILPLCEQDRYSTVEFIQQGSNVVLGLRYALLPRFESHGIVKHQPLVVLDFSHMTAAKPQDTVENAAEAQGVLESTLAPRAVWERIFPPGSVMPSKLPCRIVVGPDDFRLRPNGRQRIPADLVMQPDGFTVVVG